MLYELAGWLLPACAAPRGAVWFVYWRGASAPGKERGDVDRGVGCRGAA